MENKNILMAQKVAAAVDKAGGKTYYVGGYVRDKLMGIENKDVDIEVHGITPQALFAILDSLGERLNIGTSFGILGLRHYELDISMPRTEKATGRGHKDFEIFVDPFLGEEKAAVRRDFTINALMQNVLTGEVLDFFGGKEDMRDKVLRHVNDTTYLEDPLRVLRAAQFAARFGFAVAAETIRLSSQADLMALPGERIMGELEKALLKSDQPSVFFEQLRAMEQLSDWFPEAQALIGVPQRADYHPEGDAWAHTMQVTDAAAAYRESSAQPLYFMLAALCHDFGKAVATQVIDGIPHAYNHEILGLPLIRQFLNRLTHEKKMKDYVLNLAKLHMQPHRLAGDAAHTKSFMKMFHQTPYPEDLLLLSKADHMGCLARGASRRDEEEAYAPTECKLREKLALYRERIAAPYVTGEDLIQAGLKPGKEMGETLAYVEKMRLAGVPKEEQLKQALAFARDK